MALTLTWGDVLLRLLLAVAVGLLIGYNRTHRGKAAGMVTTVLVTVSAAVAMIQVNLLLPTAGRPPSSFVMNDLMRLPLGVLTGVGFIGAGAILRREDLVVGVTTAATLWLLTIIGLCLGGGQIGLGLAATLLGLLALSVVKACENRLRAEHRARLKVELDTQGPTEDEVRERLEREGLRIVAARTRLSTRLGRRSMVFQVCYMQRAPQTQTPVVVRELASAAISVEWRTLS
jgi:putative Mg2+ transporter-C (MgtC) family protein